MNRDEYKFGAVFGFDKIPYFRNRIKKPTKPKIRLRAFHTLPSNQEFFQRKVDAFEENYEKWKGRLEGIDPKKAINIAMVLENQRLYYQDACDPLMNCGGLDLVQKLFSEFLGFDLVSVQPLMGPAGQVFWRGFTASENGMEYSIELGETGAKTRRIRTNLKLDDVAKNLADEFTREIISDLTKNTGHQWSDVKFKHVISSIQEMSRRIHRATCRGSANWLVANPSIIKAFTDQSLSQLCLTKVDANIQGLAGYTLIADPLFPADKILCGLRTDLLKGYYYCPYIPITCTSKEGEDQHFVTRFAKKMNSKAPYGLLTIKI